MPDWVSDMIGVCLVLPLVISAVSALWFGVVALSGGSGGAEPGWAGPYRDGIPVRRRRAYWMEHDWTGFNGARGGWRFSRQASLWMYALAHAMNTAACAFLIFTLWTTS